MMHRGRPRPRSWTVLSSIDRPRRIIVCTPFPPRLDARHGGKATAQLLLRLAERNDVAVLTLTGSGGEGVSPEIRERCERVVEVARPARDLLRSRARWALDLLRGVPPWASDCRSDEYRERLEELVDDWPPDVVEIHFQAMAQYVAVPARRNLPRILVDYDPASAWATEMLAGTTGPRRLLRRAEVAAWRRNERTTRPRFNAIVVFADSDLREIGSTAGPAKLVRVPLAVEVPARALDPAGADPPTIVFVGSFGHPPNVDAANWLARSIFPRVLERVPEARLELVGQAPRGDVLALAGARVSVQGSVPDVTPYLDRAAVVVAPIRLGGSMRMKVLEAMAAGKALVATPRAAEGVDAVAAEHFVLASDEDEMVDALATLLLDPERREALARRARSWAEQTLGWAHGVTAFEQLYDELAEARADEA
jgi:glycosyltransferase involved in cell wall biosynthesis